MLTKVVEATKGKLMLFYDDILSFFQSIFKESNKYDYIVFLTQRSTNLVEIFSEIIFSGKSSQMPSNFISSSALLALTPVIAEKYETRGRFPSILVVEDIHVFGETLNTLLEELEAGLYEELRQRGRVKEEIAVSLASAVSIRAFTRNNKPTLILPRYQSKFFVSKTMEPKQWRPLCNSVCRLTCSAGQVNPNFVVGSNIQKEQTNWETLLRAGFSQVDTIYNTSPQKLFYRTILLPNSNHVIYTIRIVPSCITNNWVAVPFVFLPKMTEQQVDSLMTSVLSSFKSQLGSSSLKILDYWQDYPQAKLETLVMLLSISLLKEICKLLGKPIEYTGTLKLRMNFGTGANDDVKKFIEQILFPGTQFLSIGQMDKLLTNSFGTGTFTGYVEYGCQLDNGGDTLKELIEDYIYKMSMSYYSKDYWRTQMSQKDSFDCSEETSDHYIPLSTMMYSLNRICSGKYSFPQMLGWILQLIDGGYLGLAVKSLGTGQAKYLAPCIKAT